jgi:hypothetical protein
MKFYVRTSRVTIHTSQRQVQRLLHFGIYQSYGSFRMMSHVMSIREVIALLVPFATCLQH